MNTKLKSFLKWCFPSLFSNKIIIPKIPIEIDCKNFMRRNVLGIFFVKILDQNLSDVKVLVIGGDEHEYELQILKLLKISYTVSYLNEDNPDFNLNLFGCLPNSMQSRFDLVLCSQVIEHIWNHDAFFENLIFPIKEGGLLWLACPTSNFPHLSSEYFSAGFTSKYLEQNLKYRGLEVLYHLSFGSRRNYAMTHFLNRWPTNLSHKYPIINNEYSFSVLKRLLVMIKQFVPSLMILLRSPKLTDEISSATESICFASK